MRYVEPPTKRKGNPFVAVRVDAATHAKFVKLCAKLKITPADKLRAMIARAVA